MSPGTWLTDGEEGKPTDRYAALWVEKSGDDDARMYVGVTAAEARRFRTQLKDAEADPPDPARHGGSGWQARDIAGSGEDRQEPPSRLSFQDQFEGNFEQNQADRSADRLLIDLRSARRHHRRPSTRSVPGWP